MKNSDAIIIVIVLAIAGIAAYFLLQEKKIPSAVPQGQNNNSAPGTGGLGDVSAGLIGLKNPVAGAVAAVAPYAAPIITAATPLGLQGIRSTENIATTGITTAGGVANTGIGTAGGVASDIIRAPERIIDKILPW